MASFGQWKANLLALSDTIGLSDVHVRVHGVREADRKAEKQPYQAAGIDLGLFGHVGVVMTGGEALVDD